MLNGLIDALCWKLVFMFPNRVRHITRDGKYYLTRFYITTPRDARDSSDGVDEKFGLYLHFFHVPDIDDQLHNHPWSWAVSLILCGGYNEERYKDWDDISKLGAIIERTVKPCTLNFISHSDFHRVTSLPDNKSTWTLFMTGPRTTRWGFKDRKTGEYYDWEDFLRMKGEVL